MKADVTGLPVSVPEVTETTALGAAFLALVGTRAYASLKEASDRIVRIRERIDPDPSTRSAYDESYERYRQTYFALLPVFEETARRSA
jgi:autoinducer 2 (AI-2) kinase